MTKLHFLLAFGLLAAGGVGCDKVSELLQHKDKSADESADEDDDDDDSDKEPEKKKKKKKKKKKVEKGFLADTGFRPEKDGFAFKNTGGQYPATPPVLNENVMVKLFGDRACVGGDTKECTLTLPAAEWAHMINRAMNGGQCEGMAVASLTFFKGVDKPKELLAFSAHSVDRKEVTPLIAYYWAYQAVDPVMFETRKARRTTTPNAVEDKLVEMFKKGELATIAFWNPRGRGGHAVTPYAVEDKGNGIHWIKIYDNNYPDKDRYIVIDRNANSWKYDLAALNPDQPKMPWGGSADSHNIVVLPMDLRLKKAVCPFCEDNDNKTTIMPRSAAISITDQEGRRIAVEGENVINEVPGAEVMDWQSYLEGTAALEPIFVVPSDNDYDITIAGQDTVGTSPGAAAGDDDKGVTIFSAGAAVSVEGAKVNKTDKDTLSIGREGGGVRYRPGSGRMPSLKLAVDDKKEGVSVRVANMKADADSEVELKLDRKTRRVLVQGGGKSTDSYDLELKHVGGGERGVERTEQKGVRFKLGESHGIETKRAVRLKPGAKPAPIKINRGVYVRPAPKPRLKDKDKDPKVRDNDKDPKVRDNDKDPKVRVMPPKPGDPPSRPKPGPAGAAPSATLPSNPRAGGPKPPPAKSP